MSAEMVPSDRSKYADVAEPGRPAQAFFNFE
jgi:hypothetical protein